MPIRKITVPRYVTTDGAEFDSLADAETHEAKYQYYNGDVMEPIEYKMPEGYKDLSMEEVMADVMIAEGKQRFPDNA